MVKKMTEEELILWDNIYMYVKFDILKMEEWQNVDKNTVLRIKGLKDGHFVANPNIIPKAFYTWEELYLAFKYSKLDIIKAFSSVQTKDINHKTNLMLKIVESNLNVVVDKLIAKKQAEARMDRVELTESSTIKYKKKSKETKNSKLKDMI